MADYGTNMRYTRAKVTAQVLRGFSPTEPGKLSSLAAPLDPADTVGVAIKSGMAIVKDDGTIAGVAGSGFRNAVAADSQTSKSIYFALHDADAHDVQASGKLVGLDCSDKFEVQTGYYDSSIIWAVDMPVTVGAGGIFTEAAVAGDIVVGYISEVGTGTNNTIITGGKTPSAVDMSVIQFKTAQSGLVIPA